LQYFCKNHHIFGRWNTYSKNGCGQPFILKKIRKKGWPQGFFDTNVKFSLDFCCDLR
jgi:hypothetical protein